LRRSVFDDGEDVKVVIFQKYSFPLEASINMLFFANKFVTFGVDLFIDHVHHLDLSTSKCHHFVEGFLEVPWIWGFDPSDNFTYDNLFPLYLLLYLFGEAVLQGEGFK
jgi:hypothetical protein